MGFLDDPQDFSVRDLKYNAKYRRLTIVYGPYLTEKTLNYDDIVTDYLLEGTAVGSAAGFDVRGKGYASLASSYSSTLDRVILSVFSPSLPGSPIHWNIAAATLVGTGRDVTAMGRGFASLSGSYNSTLDRIVYSTFVPSTVGVIQRTATLVVAASDATQAFKDTAGPYVCDGTDDDVQLQAAFNALPSGGGKIVFSNGSFSLASQITRAINNITIEGQGRATKLNLDGSTAVIDAGSQAGWIIRELDTDAGGVDVDSAKDTVVDYWLSGQRVLKFQSISNLKTIDIVGSSPSFSGAGLTFTRDPSATATTIDYAGFRWRFDDTVAATNYDVGLLAHRYHSSGSFHDHLSVYTSDVSKTPVKRIDLEFRKALAKLTLRNLDLEFNRIPFRVGGATEATIASGAITASQVYHSVDTEGDAASDDLDTISGGDEGSIVILHSENSARDVRVTEKGNVVVEQGLLHLRHNQEYVGFIKRGAIWFQLWPKVDIFSYKDSGTIPFYAGSLVCTFTHSMMAQPSLMMLLPQSNPSMITAYATNVANWNASLVMAGISTTLPSNLLYSYLLERPFA